MHDDWMGYDALDIEAPEEETYGFKDEEDAVFQLYEALFDSKLKKENPHIYEALRFLIWNKGMHDLYEEMVGLTNEFELIEWANL